LFGEFGPSSWGRRYHLELALRLRLPTLFREIKNSRNRSPVRALAGQLLATLLPRRGIDVSLLFTSDFRRECKAKPVWRSRSPYQRRYQEASIRYWLGKHAVERGQTMYPVRPSHPLLDKRILEFCLALPGSMDVGKGYPRYPVRAALDGILPPRIQWRTDKTHFSPDYYARYNAQLGMAQDFVRAIGPRDPVRTIVDVERLAKMLVPVDPVAGLASARDEVPMTLYLIGFLRQFTEFRP
jgi:asparagine synthase (glutamine-hydrolysing)